MKLVARVSSLCTCQGASSDDVTDIIDKDNGNITVASDVEDDYLPLLLAAPDVKVQRDALLTALSRLVAAAFSRENRAGDPCGYLEAVAELRAAANAANAEVKKEKASGR